MKRKVNKDKQLKVVTPAAMDKFRTDFDKAMANLQIKYGMQITLGSGRYDNDSFHMKLSAIITHGESGDVVAKNLFIKNCKYKDVSPDVWGKDFVFKGTTYIVWGIALNARKKFIELKRAHDGVIVRSDVSFLKYIK